MKPDHPEHPAPPDGPLRKAVAPVICYPVDGLPRPDLAGYRAARDGWTLETEVLVPPREARCFTGPGGLVFPDRQRRWSASR